MLQSPLDRRFWTRARRNWSTRDDSFIVHPERFRRAFLSLGVSLSMDGSSNGRMASLRTLCRLRQSTETRKIHLPPRQLLLPFAKERHCITDGGGLSPRIRQRSVLPFWQHTSLVAAVFP